MKKVIIFGFLLLIMSSMYAQILPHDTIPMADSINAVYIYADTGTAVNRVDVEGRKVGLWEKRYPDGHLRYRGHFIDGKPYGVFKNYYDTVDSLQSIRVFSDDGNEAYIHMFYTTGALYAEGKYVNEKKDSIWKFYDAMQRLVIKSQYANGKREGKSEVFYPEDGNILQIKNWKNDKEDGPFQEYLDGGILRKEGTYMRGMLEDTLYVYDDEGRPYVKGNYLHDMKEGDWIYYKEGEPKDTLIYHQGKCMNAAKYTPTKTQMDSLKLHYQGLQEQLDHPSNDLGRQHPVPPGGEE